MTSATERVLEDANDDAIEGVVEAVFLVKKYLDKILRSPEVESAVTIDVLRRARGLAEEKIDRLALAFGDDTEERAREAVNSAAQDLAENGRTSEFYVVRAAGIGRGAAFHLRLPERDGVIEEPSQFVDEFVDDLVENEKDGFEALRIARLGWDIVHAISEDMAEKVEKLRRDMNGRLPKKDRKR